MEQVFEFYWLAAELHRGQLDKAGQPYVNHLLRVMRGLPEDASRDMRIAALLHDAVEDDKSTLMKLAAIGVPARALELVDALTRRPGETYSGYLLRLRADPDAVVIKRADLADNLDHQRLALLDPALAARLHTKYTDALELLHAG